MNDDLKMRYYPPLPRPHEDNPIDYRAALAALRARRLFRDPRYADETGRMTKEQKCLAIWHVYDKVRAELREKETP